MSDFDRGTLFNIYLVKSLFLEAFFIPSGIQSSQKPWEGSTFMHIFLDEKTSSRILCSCYKLVAKYIFEPRPSGLQSSHITPCF